MARFPLDPEEPHGTHNTLSMKDPFEYKETEEAEKKQRQEEAGRRRSF